MKFSSSDISAYMRCKLMWDWTSQNRRNLESASAHKALILGKYIHIALEMYYRTHSNLVDTFQTKLEEALVSGEAAMSQADLEEVFAMGSQMMDDYSDYWEFVTNTQPDKDIRVLLTEQEIQVPIPGTAHWYIGTMDGLCLDYWDRLWVLEHKTFKSAPPIDGWMNSSQASGYTWCAQQLINAGHQPWLDLGIRQGQRIHGVLYNGMRKPLKTPKPLEEMFTRTSVGRTHAQLAQWEADLQHIVADMTRPKLPIYPNPTNNCRWECAFVDACTLRTVGGDPEPVLATFRNRAPRGAVYGEE
jgi:hypothetical protein